MPQRHKLNISIDIYLCFCFDTLSSSLPRCQWNLITFYVRHSSVDIPLIRHEMQIYLRLWVVIMMICITAVAVTGCKSSDTRQAFVYSHIFSPRTDTVENVAWPTVTPSICHCGDSNEDVTVIMEAMYVKGCILAIDMCLVCVLDPIIMFEDASLETLTIYTKMVCDTRIILQTKI